MDQPAPVDSFRFLDFLTRKLVHAWIDREPRRDIPWTPLGRPLAEATVALVSTAAIARVDDRPFDQEGERRDPWWGDPSYRVIPRDTGGSEARTYHLHVDPRPVAEDWNVAFPLDRLLALERSGEIGRAAPSHYSFMGYLLDPTAFLRDSVPAMVERLKLEQVDLALLVPY